MAEKACSWPPACRALVARSMGSHRHVFAMWTIVPPSCSTHADFDSLQLQVGAEPTVLSLVGAGLWP